MLNSSRIYNSTYVYVKIGDMNYTVVFYTNKGMWILTLVLRHNSLWNFPPFH